MKKSPAVKEKEKVKSKNGKIALTREMLDKMRYSIQTAFEGQALMGDKREYSTGSVGYNVSGKVIIDGVRCQVACNVIAIGSRDVK